MSHSKADQWMDMRDREMELLRGIDLLLIERNKLRLALTNIAKYGLGYDYDRAELIRIAVAALREE